MTSNEILHKYTLGQKTVEETNKALEEIGSSVYVDPDKNTITEEEIRQTTIGAYPDMANGYGLLDTGTGTLDKVQVKDGKLAYPVNTPNEQGEYNARAEVLICGKTYIVHGDKLVEE